MSEAQSDNKPGIGFRLLKSYIRFFHGKFFYKRTYWLNTENIPDEGPLMIVSDHQNGLSDVLGILMSIPNRTKRKTRVVARGDIFTPLLQKPLRWLGLMPAFRLSFDGEEALANNAGTFEEMEQELLNDGTVVLYPEAGHQDKRWLGQFSLAYLHILFETAEKTGFEKEFFVLPSCNHYSDYFHAREEMLVCYGTPISIAPYYELYKTKPRTAQRQVNQLVRKQISDMMLNIADLEHYASIDFLRETYGHDYAVRLGYNPQKLPEKLLADQQFVKELDKAKTQDEEAIGKVYDDVDSYRRELEALNITDRNIKSPAGACRLIGKGLFFLLLLPLFALSCVPNLLIYLAPRLITAKIKDRFLHSGFDFGVTALVSGPVLYASTFALVWRYSGSLLVALICLLCLPLGGLFMYYYIKGMKGYRKELRFHKLKRKGRLNELILQRKQLWETLDDKLETRIEKFEVRNQDEFSYSCESGVGVFET